MDPSENVSLVPSCLLSSIGQPWVKFRSQALPHWRRPGFGVELRLAQAGFEAVLRLAPSLAMITAPPPHPPPPPPTLKVLRCPCQSLWWAGSQSWKGQGQDVLPPWGIL